MLRVTALPDETADVALPTRERILAATREVYERNGTRGTTTREIAERAGVNEATIFRQFGSKTALIEHMRESACTIAGLQPTLAGLSGADIQADLRVVCRTLYANIVERRALILIGLAEEMTDPDAASTVMRQPTRIYEQLSAYLQGQVERGTIEGDPQTLAGIVMGMMFTLAIKSRRLDFSGRSADEMIDAFLDAILNGVRK